jgi:hypothetical protein
MIVGISDDNVVDVFGRFDAHFNNSFARRHWIKVDKVGQGKGGDDVLVVDARLRRRAA